MLINETPFDRALRGALGLALLATPLVGFHIGPWNFLGLVPLITGIVGYCPLYGALGMSTCTEDSYQHRKDGVLLRDNSAPGRHATHAA
jgi:hypothetical protein